MFLRRHGLDDSAGSVSKITRSINVDTMEQIVKFTAANGEEISLRPASPEDAAEILSTVKSTSLERSYVLMEQYGRDAQSERQFISSIDLDHNLLLVAVARGKVIGSLAALQADGGQIPQTAHIATVGLHLKEAYRGLGIGSRMLRYAVEWAQEHGFKKLVADIFTTNKRSLNLFRRAGFVEEGVKVKHVRMGKDYIDEVSLGKLLE